MRCLFVFLMLVLSGCAQARPSIEQYTYRIGTQDGGLCSATAVGRNTLLTAAHCVNRTDSYIYIGAERISVSQIEVDSRDHALLRVQKRLPVWAQRGPSPKKGELVQMLGNVDGFEQLYRFGTFAGWYQGALVYDMTCGKGDSGAGIFNEQGQLIGVVSAVYVGPIIQLCVSYPFAFTVQQWAGV